MSAFLRADGYEVDTVEGVDRARELLAKKKYDVVVSDIILPRISGVELLRQLRETDPEVQVIMMTGDPTVETAIEAVRAGACDYMTKPVDKPTILLAAAKASRIAALERENRSYRENLESLVEQRTAELSRALEDLKKARERSVQQERLSALGRMASGIAHDFNNALMPILGLSEFLITYPATLQDTKDTVETLQEIRGAADDARHIVRRLREFYKPEEKAASGSVNINGIMENALSLTRPRWQEEMSAEGIAIDCRVDLGDIPEITADEHELRQAFVNLILNAVDAIAEEEKDKAGSAEGAGRIEIKTGADRGWVTVSVSDTGVGMTEEMRVQCMEPFYSTKGNNGTGLGLSMVYGSVRRAGGTIDIRSQPGKGSEFRVYLPVDRSVSDSGGKPEKKGAAPSLHILIVDDDRRTRNVLSRCLEMEDHVIETVDSGGEGIELFISKSFDLVITDRALPDMSGDDVASKLKEVNSDVPVILLTGFGEVMKDKGEAPESADLLFSKPVTPAEIYHAISKVMNR